MRYLSLPFRPKYGGTGTDTSGITGQPELRAGTWYFPKNHVNVRAFGAVGDGATDDTGGLQDALDALATGWPHHQVALGFPPGQYVVTAPLTTSGLKAIRLFGFGGFDGAEPNANNGCQTRIVYEGTLNADAAVIQFTNSSVILENISVDANYLAGYGVQFVQTGTEGSVMNTIRDGNYSHAIRDGILFGNELGPEGGVVPGTRQSFANLVDRVHCYGNQRSSVHVNEYNADMTHIRMSWFFKDEATTWPCANAIWFEHGGAVSVVESCESDCAEVIGGNATSGYMIKSGSTTEWLGADGLHLSHIWSEEPALLWDKSTGGTLLHPTVLWDCHAYGAGVSGNSVYLDPAAARRYTIIGGEYFGDIYCGSMLSRGNVVSENVQFDTGVGFVDVNTKRTLYGSGIDGYYAATGVGGADYILPRFATTVDLTLTANLTGALYPEGARTGDTLRLIIRQGGAGGFTIAWGASWWFGTVSSTPEAGVGDVTVYTFVFDGTVHRCTGRVAD